MGKQSCESDSELLVDVYSLAIYVYFCKGEILSLLTFGVYKINVLEPRRVRKRIKSCNDCNIPVLIIHTVFSTKEK